MPQKRTKRGIQALMEGRKQARNDLTQGRKGSEKMQKEGKDNILCARPGSNTRWPEEEDAHLRAETDAFCKRVLPGSLDITRFSVVKEATESKKRAQHYIAVGRTCSRFVNLHDLRW